MLRSRSTPRRRPTHECRISHGRRWRWRCRIRPPGHGCEQRRPGWKRNSPGADLGFVRRCRRRGIRRWRRWRQRRQWRRSGWRLRLGGCLWHHRCESHRFAGRRCWRCGKHRQRQRRRVERPDRRGHWPDQQRFADALSVGWRWRWRLDPEQQRQQRLRRIGDLESDLQRHREYDTKRQHHRAEQRHGR